MAIRKVLGIETEYGILIRGAADSNPIAASSVLINAYVNDLTRDYGDEGRLAIRELYARADVAVDVQFVE